MTIGHTYKSDAIVAFRLQPRNDRGNFHRTTTALPFSRRPNASLRERRESLLPRYGNVGGIDTTTGVDIVSEI
jgi:hypothetical protein